MNNQEYTDLIHKHIKEPEWVEYFLSSQPGRYRNKYYKKLLQNLDRSAKILNIGDGTGVISYEQTQMGFTNIVGSDIEKKFLTVAKKICPQATFDVQDAHKLTYKDNTFDVVTFVDVIVFLKAKQAVAEAARVTKPGGLIYMENYSAKVHQNKLLKKFIITAKHYHTYTDKYMESLFKEHNLEILKWGNMTVVPRKDLSFVSKCYYAIIGALGLKKSHSPAIYYYLKKK